MKLNVILFSFAMSTLPLLTIQSLSDAPSENSVFLGWGESYCNLQVETEVAYGNTYRCVTTACSRNYYVLWLQVDSEIHSVDTDCTQQ